VLAALAAVAALIGFILQLAGKTFGNMDGIAWLLLAVCLLAAHVAFGWRPLDRR
jgi:hypothetical protein